MLKPRAVALAFLFFALLGSTVVSGQQRNLTSEGKADFAREPFVYEQILVNVSIEADGTSTRESTVRVRVQSQVGVQQLGLLVFPYDAHRENLEIVSVEVRKPDGTVVVTPATSIQDMPQEITRLAPMYSDLRAKHVAVKGLAPGDILEYRAHWRLHTPLEPGHFWSAVSFTKEAIVLKEVLQLSVPRELRLTLKSTERDPEVSEQGNRRVYVWQVENLTRKSTEEEAKAVQNAELPLPSVQFSTFQSWEEVGRWYARLVEPRVRPTAEIRAKAAELAKAAVSDAEKVRALYHYVATEVRYISLSFGLGSYQPHAAAETLANRYGDCKDKHTLLASLLAAEGLKAYPALIHSAQKLDPDVPSPAQFDHLITAVPQGEDFLWLDTTAEIAPLGFLPAVLRDKPVLVIPDAGTTRLVRTPIDPPFASFHRFNLEGKLNENGTLEAKVYNLFRGDVELVLRMAFRRTPPLQWKDIAQQLSYVWGFAGSVSDVVASQPEATDSPFSLDYTYLRENYSDWGNRRILAPSPVMMFLGIEKEADKSSEPIWLGARGEETHYTATVELPPGFNPKLPPEKEISTDFAEYRSTFSLANGILRAERRLTLRQSKIPSDRREDYRAFAKAIQDDQNTFLTEAGSVGKLAESDSAEAQAFFEEGQKALQRRDMRGARDYFERAVAVDPGFAGAWLALGMVQMALRRNEAALTALRKARELSPANPTVQEALAFALMESGRMEEALDVWKRLAELDPQNRNAANNAGSILFIMKRYSDAAVEFDKAVSLNPSGAPLYLQLGFSHLRSGNEEKGVAALQKALELDSNPTMLNNVAYELAVQTQRFSEAIGYAEKAVRAREEETAKIHLESLTSTDLERMVNLGAEWDTLGWIHFKLGDWEKAERYLRAAWSLTQSATVADHLGQVYEKKNNTSAAANAFAWSLAADSRTRRKEVRDRLWNLLKSDSRVKSAEDKAREELGKLRMVRLGKLTTKQASAEFFILFSAGAKVEGVKFVSGDETLRPAADALAAAKYDVSFPDDGPTRLVRRGLLLCMESTTYCEFVFFTPDRVRSVN